MKKVGNSTVVMPPVYELNLGMWRWCKLNEVCTVVPHVSSLWGNDLVLSPESLVQRFAALVRPNSKLQEADALGKISQKKKVFRYSFDGTRLHGKEVPFGQTLKAPPYEDFVLDIPLPYPAELFVPAGWVMDILKAIRIGAVAAADFGDIQVGFTNGDGRPFSLDGQRDPMMSPQPRFVR